MHEPAPAALISAELTIAGKRLVGPVDLEVRRGERLTLMGPNGAGKSLSLRMLHGLIAPTSGRALWNGELMTRAARADQAMVFQRPVMLRRSAAGNIDYALAARGTPRNARRAMVADALAQAGLTHRARAPARALSGGEQQRLAMARALALKPRLLLLDEPTANLDPAAAIALEAMALQAHADGVTIVLVTHDAAQARRLADRVAFFHHGRIIEQASAERFFSDPESDPAQAFLEGRLFA